MWWSLTLALCVAQTPGLEVRLSGVAKNAKGGAVLLVNGAPVYIEHLAEWPAALVDTRVDASGELVDLAYLPEHVTAEPGALSQGTTAGTTQRVLRHAKWAAPPPPPPKPVPSGLSLRPTQRVGVMFAGLTVVLGGTALGLGLSANADARALELADDPAREARMRTKRTFTGVLGGLAGATLIAAIVCLALPPQKAAVAPVISVTPAGAMVGLSAWF